MCNNGFYTFCIPATAMFYYVFNVLAGRTNGCSYATVLRRSLCHLSSSSVTLRIVAKRCVLEQKLLLTAFRSRIREINWYQNE